MTLSYDEYEMSEYDMSEYEMSEYEMTISVTSGMK
jgi:hypothetical protein